MTVTEKMTALLENAGASDALSAAINKLTAKYKGAWREMTDAEAEEIGGLFRQMSPADQKYWAKGYKAERDAMQKVIDAGKGFKGALHQSSDEDIVTDMNRMLKAFGA
jgi:hypothetical protein